MPYEVSDPKGKMMTLSDSAKSQIEAHLAKSRVVLFMKGNKHFPQCGFSAQVVKILSDVGVPFDTVNVLQSPEIRDGIKAYTDWPTIPQLYVDGKFVGGCDIVKDLYGSGELAALLGTSPAGSVKAAEEVVAPPTITLTASAKNAVVAADDGSGDTLRLEINTEFQYDLYFGPKEPTDVETLANGVVVRMDPGTARRANGMSIDWVTAQGGAFKIENPNEPPRVRPLSVEGLKEMMDKGEAFELVDVRTEGERALAKIERAKHFDTHDAEISALDHDTILVFQCHHGMRSRNAAELFLRKGFRKVYNLEGGIDAWSLKVDPTVARY